MRMNTEKLQQRTVMKSSSIPIPHPLSSIPIPLSSNPIPYPPSPISTPHPHPLAAIEKTFASKHLEITVSPTQNLEITIYSASKCLHNQKQCVNENRMSLERLSKALIFKTWGRCSLPSLYNRHTRVERLRARAVGSGWPTGTSFTHGLLVMKTWLIIPFQI